MKLADVIAVLESAYPPKTAETWDAVGLVCGDPQEEVTRVLVCVDPTSSTVDEAVERGAQLVLAHHPLLLKGVNGVPADDPKGALVHKLIRNGAALYCAHTNADSASPGVSDALAKAIGLTVTGPLEPAEPEGTGLGRVGELAEPEPLRAFAQRVAAALPATVQGVRAAGDPEHLIRRVAVCGGAGDSFLDAVKRAGVDAYVTADLRHHPVSEHIESGGPALVDVAHWASEWPWCEQAAEILRAAFGGRVDVLVSTRRTDPWTVGATSTAVGGHA
ncbi:dinuclear metal center protein, YbgI/SA1388 family [Lentzea albidocapillata subsp. violacea]|uniref:GTP cyclohydrolase 1 type 2 homolog n=1 Tax=Lentzea albidocapillata subsp. violacea TaxID=128104 RepID=A0A1G9QCG0_9PSEU|nr:Nif3-like dinuclear metal center hexameric protein [Lentzea albidocapillata]SDM08752.1 dinuclear metal center protein, YbgI/SA1388 family [Lentzea albidocapillata subsp. violacea]